MAQATDPGLAWLGPGFGPGLRNPKPEPDEAKPKPWFPGQAKPAKHYLRHIRPNDIDTLLALDPNPTLLFLSFRCHINISFHNLGVNDLKTDNLQPEQHAETTICPFHTPSLQKLMLYNSDGIKSLLTLFTCALTPSIQHLHLTVFNGSLYEKLSQSL
ncbi:hypothetical protein DFH09DRAFT_1110878 [Mycena vulgaris]|nr:hypothetical protein DFH09DRAFT_1110878 [Mycena vulgaris]